MGDEGRRNGLSFACHSVSRGKDLMDRMLLIDMDSDYTLLKEQESVSRVRFPF